MPEEDTVSGHELHRVLEEETAAAAAAAAGGPGAPLSSAGLPVAALGGNPAVRESDGDGAEVAPVV